MLDFRIVRISNLNYLFYETLQIIFLSSLFFLLTKKNRENLVITALFTVSQSKTFSSWEIANPGTRDPQNFKYSCSTSFQSNSHLTFLPFLSHIHGAEYGRQKCNHAWKSQTQTLCYLSQLTLKWYYFLNGLDVHVFSFLKKTQHNNIKV